ncbi:MAG: ATP-binding protein [Pseudomonadota bacterium]
MTQLRRYLPRSLFGRALLILVLPIVLIQFTVGGIFADRIFNEMTGIMSSNFVRVINQTTKDFAKASDSERGAVVDRSEALGLSVREIDALPTEDPQHTPFYDLTALYVERNLEDQVVGIREVAMMSPPANDVTIWVERDGTILELSFARRFVSARNPHQLPLIMVFTSLLLTAIAVFFLRNQIKPIKLLAQAAEAFGQGRVMQIRPRGATEVRQATTSFLGMRERIERHIDQRTLMLSGVSHDLRTPLTRLKLGLSMLGPDRETADMHRDIDDMENIIKEFLDFAGEDFEETPVDVDPKTLLQGIVENFLRSKHALNIETRLPEVEADPVMWRQNGITRAVENVLNNAARFAIDATVTLSTVGKEYLISIEDNGPGIPEADLENALNAFVRLDESRNQNKGSGVGLGLAITHDIIRSHGGKLTLSRSTDLGGLRVEMRLPKSTLSENGRPGGT